MEEDVKLPDVPEATVRFNVISDRSIMNVISEETQEVLIEISGYDLNINFNMEHLNSLQEIEAACEGIKELFKQVILEKKLGPSQPNS